MCKGEKKFLTWLTNKLAQKKLKVKLAIKEEMESSKYGIFKKKIHKRLFQKI